MSHASVAVPGYADVRGVRYGGKADARTKPSKRRPHMLYPVHRPACSIFHGVQGARPSIHSAELGHNRAVSSRSRPELSHSGRRPQSGSRARPIGLNLDLQTCIGVRSAVAKTPAAALAPSSKAEILQDRTRSLAVEYTFPEHRPRSARGARASRFPGTLPESGDGIAVRFRQRKYHLAWLLRAPVGASPEVLRSPLGSPSDLLKPQAPALVFRGAGAAPRTPRLCCETLLQAPARRRALSAVQ